MIIIALTDAIRVGKVREQKMAAQIIKERVENA